MTAINSVTAAIMPRESGMTMRKKMPTSLQPSLMAASSSSRETEKEK